MGFIEPIYAQSEVKSGSYIIAPLNIGSELTVLTPQTTIKPVISAAGPVLSDVTDTQATISWETDKTSTSVVRFNVKGATATAEQGDSVNFVTKHKVTLIGLTPNTAYEFVVRSIDKLGNLGTTAKKTFTTEKSAGISEVTFSDITLTSFILSFKTASVVNTEVVYGTDTNYGSSIKEESGSFTTSHVIRFTNLPQGTTYHLRIKATDKFGKILFSDDYVAATLPKPTISDVSFQNVSSNETIVSWKTNTKTDSLVEYWTNAAIKLEGLLPGEKRTEGSSNLTTNHAVKLKGLPGDTAFQIIIRGRDDFGNQAESGTLTFQTAKDTTPPKITNLGIDTSDVARSEGSRVQAIVSWTTDEPATSTVNFGQGSPSQSTATTETYATSHVVVLQGLAPAASYKIQAESKDPAGNKGKSDETTFLTARQRRSLFDLLLNKLDDIFGGFRKLFRN